MSLDQALSIVRAAGYRVSKPRTVRTGPSGLARPLGLNAVGKPFSPSYDPNYRIKHKTTTAHLFKPYGPGIRLTSWNQ
jgi:hypothetical protein